MTADAAWGAGRADTVKPNWGNSFEFLERINTEYDAAFGLSAPEVSFPKTDTVSDEPDHERATFLQAHGYLRSEVAAGRLVGVQASRYSVSALRAAQLGMPHDALTAGVKAMLDYVEGDDAGEVAAIWNAMLPSVAKIGDLLFKVADFPLADEIAERLRDENAALRDQLAEEEEQSAAMLRGAFQAGREAVDAKAAMLRDAFTAGREALDAKDARIAELKSRLACEQGQPTEGGPPVPNAPPPPPNPPQGNRQISGPPDHNPFNVARKDPRLMGP